MGQFGGQKVCGRQTILIDWASPEAHNFQEQGPMHPIINVVCTGEKLVSGSHRNGS